MYKKAQILSIPGTVATNKASKYLKHYLDNSGNLYNITMYDYITSGSGYDNFQKNVNDMLEACENGIKNGTEQYLTTNRKVGYSGTNYEDSVYSAVSNANKWLSIGSSNALMVSHCINNNGTFDIELKYYLTDCYDWTLKNIFFIDLDDLNKLHRIGLARCFESRGCYEVSFSWEKGERLGAGIDANMIIQPPTPNEPPN